MAYWLVKSEPETYSIDDLKRDRKTLWDGVRNYQARNYLKQMKKGDEVLFYHSNANPPAIVGIARVAAIAVADPSQFDKKSPYFDAKSTQASPRWVSPLIEFRKKLPVPLGLENLRSEHSLKSMELLKRGSRLSVQPVTAAQWEALLRLAQRG